MTSTLPPLDDALLARRLLIQSGGAYARIERVDSVESTNQWLIEALAAEGQSPTATAWPHLSALTAEEQTGGRGRLGRAWSSPKGASLSTSLVLRPQIDPGLRGWLSMLAGRALVDTLRQDFGLDAETQRAVLKWPNDVQVTQPEGPAKKISGILAVAAPEPDAVVLGVGINVLLTAEQLPIENSTSVLLELRRAASSAAPRAAMQATRSLAHPEKLRTELLCCFLERFAELLRRAEVAAAQGPESVTTLLAATVSDVLSTLGQQVRVELPDGTAERGVAQELAPDGALRAEVTATRSEPDRPWVPVAPLLRTFAAGDVTHLRAIS